MCPLPAMCVSITLCFFFKQKTAYEMRISDWSSDVCSSDLALSDTGRHGRPSHNPPSRRLSADASNTGTLTLFRSSDANPAVEQVVLKCIGLGPERGQHSRALESTCQGGLRLGVSGKVLRQHTGKAAPAPLGGVQVVPAQAHIDQVRPRCHRQGLSITR